MRAAIDVIQIVTYTPTRLHEYQRLLQHILVFKSVKWDCTAWHPDATQGRKRNVLINYDGDIVPAFQLEITYERSGTRPHGEQSNAIECIRSSVLVREKYCELPTKKGFPVPNPLKIPKCTVQLF